MIALLFLLLVPLTALAQPREFRDCVDCPLMVTIPAGRFTMGVPAAEEGAEGVPAEFRGFSTPNTRIAFAQPFALGKYPVTHAEFSVFLRDSGHARSDTCWRMTDQGNGRWRLQESPGTHGERPDAERMGEHPVVCVSWHDARAYVGWLARRTGQRYRLPSEAEWEYAARAGTTGTRYWAGGGDAACTHANVREDSLARHYNLRRDGTFFPCVDGFAHTSPVGSFPANPFGLSDMLGNVWQWAGDCWNRSLQGQPSQGTARLSGDCALRVVRGGSWSNAPWGVRAGYRVPDAIGYRSTTLGFRVVRQH